MKENGIMAKDKDMVSIRILINLFIMKVIGKMIKNKAKHINSTNKIYFRDNFIKISNKDLGFNFLKMVISI